MAYCFTNKSSTHQNNILITGNNSTQAITGLGFQPDMVWTKKRNGAANHLLYDVARGVGHYLYPNLTNAQGGNGTNSAFEAFGTDGFTLNSGDDANVSGATGVAWCWKAGNAAGSSNTDGTINTASTSVNSAAGFSISKYAGNSTSGATVGHGLGVVPEMIWIKRIGNHDGMVVYHKENGATYHMKTDRSNARASGTGYFNDTAPTSSVVTLGNDTGVNQSDNYMMYCFASKVGYSQIGGYVGMSGASANEKYPFIYCGFKPSFILIKNRDASQEWVIYDNKRNGYNTAGNEKLLMDLDHAESDITEVDIFSNGFRLKNTGNQTNANANLMVYYAVGQPLVGGTNNVPCTAR